MFVATCITVITTTMRNIRDMYIIDIAQEQ